MKIHDMYSTVMYMLYIMRGLGPSGAMINIFNLNILESNIIFHDINKLLYLIYIFFKKTRKLIDAIVTRFGFPTEGRNGDDIKE